MNKIKEEQLTKIKDQQTSLNNTIAEIGILETKKHQLLHNVASINASIEKNKKELEKEYGSININLEDGTYTEAVEETEEPAVAAV